MRCNRTGLLMLCASTVPRAAWLTSGQHPCMLSPMNYPESCLWAYCPTVWWVLTAFCLGTSVARYCLIPVLNNGRRVTMVIRLHTRRSIALWLTM